MYNTHKNVCLYLCTSSYASLYLLHKFMQKSFHDQHFNLSYLTGMMHKELN